MVYVERNEAGEIITLKRDADRPEMECKTTIDTEILDFLGRTETDALKRQLLASSDTSIARILEDIVDLLIRKNLIMFTELPEAAQQKILARKQLRRQMGEGSIIVEDVL